MRFQVPPLPEFVALTRALFLSRYGKTSACCLFCELAVNIREGCFQGLAIQAAADNLFPVDDEVSGVQLVSALGFHCGFDLGLDSLCLLI